jgi:hypothetical protein
MIEGGWLWSSVESGFKVVVSFFLAFKEIWGGLFLSLSLSLKKKKLIKRRLSTTLTSPVAKFKG